MLQSLELFGFKSFAERTTFEFASGLTAVVGPNGSGKSNVVDGIKWILGDQSPKSLRGKEMTDVIFNGATGRKPANVAEATLTFDNRTGFLPTQEKVVRVGRRLFRNGDSEYLLNGQVVRLKDIRDLFLGTGAGSAAYAIIEQGRVDQILQANASGRRAVFEEAAGISRYKTKRAEALRRLERVEQNLLRLTDIVDEVESQLNSTRTQAVKAEKYRHASRELERWWLGLAADEYRYASAERRELQDHLSVHQAESDTIAREQSALEVRVSAAEKELSVAEEELRTAETAAVAGRERIAGHQATIQFQNSRLEDLEGELTRLRRQLAVMSIRVTEATAEREHNSEVLAASQKDRSTRKELLEASDAEIARLSEIVEGDRKVLAANRQRQFDRMRQVAEIENRIALARKEQAALQRDLERSEVQLEQSQRDQAALDSDFASRREELEFAEADERVRRAAVDDLRQTREHLTRDRERLAEEVASLRERRSTLSGRIAVLEDLQARGEGFGIGVREILRRSRSINDAPWNRIYGTVSDLLDVDLAEAPLLEIALGERAQLVVVEDFASLIPYLKRSSSQINGRVGFFSQGGEHASGIGAHPVDRSEFAGVRYLEVSSPAMTSGGKFHQTSSRGTSSTTADLGGLPGVIKRADEMVRATSQRPELAARLLSDTWVVGDLETALRLSSGLGRGQRFVTLAGELLDADRTLVVGTLRMEVAVVSRRSELLSLRDQLVAADVRIEQLEQRQEAIVESQADSNLRVRKADDELRKAGDRVHRLRTKVADAERSSLQTIEIQRVVVAGMTELQKRIDELSLSLKLSVSEMSSSRDELAELEAGLITATQSAERLDQQLNLAMQRKSAAELESATAEERISNLKGSLVRLEKDLIQRTTQFSEAQRRFAAAIVKQSELTRHVLHASAFLAEAALEREAASEAVRLAARNRNRLKAETETLKRRDAELRNRRRTVAEALHGAELAVQELEHRLTGRAVRIKEEYSRDPAELAAEGHSAVALWRDSQNNASKPDEERSGSELEEVDFPAVRSELEAQVEVCRKRLRALGAVNTESLENLEDLENRYGILKSQLDDLVEAKRMLEEIIRRINTESRRIFAETFEEIQGHFRVLFRKLFGGGEGDVVLDDPTDILESGIDLIARPPGKELRSLSLLSGGEKAMVCVALLLAIFRSKPSPFCLLDEVDAPLDEANIGRFVGVLKEFKQSTQFIMITHRKPSMCEADVLYGVTMEQAGVSKRLNVRFDDVADDGSFRPARQAA